MKRAFFLVMILPASLCSFAQEQSPYQVKPLNGSINEVYSQTSGGNISVMATSSDPRVEVFVRPSNLRIGKLSKEEIQQRLDEQYDLSVEVTGNKVSAIAKPKKRNMDWKRSLSISFRIYVPATVSSDLTTSGGNIDLSGLHGTQRFTTSGGNLTVHDVQGHINGVTSGGNIEADYCSDDISLATSGGNIKANSCHGKLVLSTSGGNINMDNLDGNVKSTTSGGNLHGETIQGDLDAHTSGGNVTLTNLSCNLSSSTSGGHIDVSMKKPGKYIRLNNSGGNIDLNIAGGNSLGLDLDITGDHVRAGNLKNFSGKIEKDAINGKINGGGVQVRIDSNGGNVRITLD